MIMAIMANTGYFVGIGIEGFIIVVCGVLLALMLTGLLFKWMSAMKESRTVRAEARAAEAEARAVAAEEAAAQAEAERAEAEARAMAEAEARAAERERLAAEKAAADAAKAEAAAAAAEEEEEEAEEAEAEAEEEEEEPEEEVKKPKKGKKAAAAEEEEDEDEDENAELSEGDSEFVVVHDGIVFNDSKTITELYEELSPEQQSYFDELREEALTKPDAELSIAKNFVTVKIGKRNLIKLLIKRGVTVAEFMLENEALKQLRLSNTNKRGKSSIKVKPTVVQVLDLTSLKVAVDMINLSYEEIMAD